MILQMAQRGQLTERVRTVPLLLEACQTVVLYSAAALLASSQQGCVIILNRARENDGADYGCLTAASCAAAHAGMPSVCHCRRLDACFLLLLHSAQAH